MFSWVNFGQVGRDGEILSILVHVPAELTHGKLKQGCYAVGQPHPGGSSFA